MRKLGRRRPHCDAHRCDSTKRQGGLGRVISTAETGSLTRLVPIGYFGSMPAAVMTFVHFSSSA